MEGGFEILGTASDGVNVVQQAGLLHPDLVLVDLRMPRLGGIEVAQELRRLPDKPSVIIFSELGGTGLREECLRRGADGFVQKSHMPEQLLREVQRLFPGNSKQA
jgi:DNA-binding NarL/FixJ family response regulator